MLHEMEWLLHCMHYWLTRVMKKCMNYLIR